MKFIDNTTEDSNEQMIAVVAPYWHYEEIIKSYMNHIEAVKPGFTIVEVLPMTFDDEENVTFNAVMQKVN